MAARSNRPNHDEKTRQKIRTSQLINRLENHVFATPDDPDFPNRVMSDSQVRAALGLLKKTMADLATQTLEMGAGTKGKLSISWEND